MNGFFVSGIGTGVGKTVVSAILTEALEADYWKPVQCGKEGGTDSDRIKGLISNHQSQIHPESYCLREPLSPHAAAALEGTEVQLAKISPPTTPRPLVIEGAGGLLVPLNSSELIIDLIAKLNAPVILVSRHVLGSINHTLLSIEALQTRRIPIAGIVFNGAENPATETVIQAFTGIPFLFRLNEEPVLNRDTLTQIVTQVKPRLRELV